jgi:hypothetical protein
MPPAAGMTMFQLCKQYADFLVICLHTICYTRSLYDRRYFDKARVYSCAVPRCKHPVLVDYINDLVASIAEELRRCSLSRINVFILSSTEQVYERFVFDVSNLPIVAQEDLHVPFTGTVDEPGQLDAQFRAAIVKLSLAETRLGALPPNCTFGVSIELRNESVPNTVTSWIETDEVASGQTFVPLKRINFGPLKLNSWVEETKAKLKLREDPMSF